MNVIAGAASILAGGVIITTAFLLATAFTFGVVVATALLIDAIT